MLPERDFRVFGADRLERGHVPSKAQIAEDVLSDAGETQLPRAPSSAEDDALALPRICGNLAAHDSQLGAAGRVGDPGCIEVEVPAQVARPGRGDSGRELLEQLRQSIVGLDLLDPDPKELAKEIAVRLSLREDREMRMRAGPVELDDLAEEVEEVRVAQAGAKKQQGPAAVQLGERAPKRLGGQGHPSILRVPDDELPLQRLALSGVVHVVEAIAVLRSRPTLLEGLRLTADEALQRPQDRYVGLAEGRQQALAVPR